MPSRSSRKRQTRLELTPLASSSPASSSYNPQIRDRAAAVRFDGSPSPAKKRKLHDVSERLISQNALPTPLPSSDLSGQAARDNVPGAEVSSSQQPRRHESSEKHRTRQQKLQFQSSADTGSVSPRRSEGSPRAAKTNFFRSQRLVRRKHDGVKEESEVSDAGLGALEDHDKAGADRPTRSKAQRRMMDTAEPSSILRKASDNLVDLGPEESGSGSDVLPTTPAAKRRKLTARQKEVSPVAIDSDDDDDVALAMRTKRRGKKSSPPPGIPNDEDEESEEERLPRSSRRRRLQSTPKSTKTEGEIVELSSASDDDAAKSRRNAEQKEIEDDLLDLRTSSQSESEPESRPPKQTPQKSARALALERLKRRRAGDHAVSIDAESEDDDDDDTAINGDDLEETPKASAASQIFASNEYDEDFVTNEGDDTLGVPEGIPLTFTRYGSMKAKDLFKFAVEWMVHKKLNPAFRNDDEIYALTFGKLNDEVQGLAGSKFMSSSWTPAFSFALRARPQIALEEINRHSAEHWMRDKCDACNRSGHPATWQVQFQGRPYHRDTLEEVGGDDSDSDSDSDARSSSSSSESDHGAPAGAKPSSRSRDRDAQGRPLVPESTTFYVGRFCMSNASTSHALTHWRFHLYEWVVEWLAGAGHDAPEAIVRRDRWSERKRRKHANRVVDEMESVGEVKRLYRDFKGEIDRARKERVGRFEGSP